MVNVSFQEAVQIPPAVILSGGLLGSETRIQGVDAHH